MNVVRMQNHLQTKCVFLKGIIAVKMRLGEPASQKKTASIVNENYFSFYILTNGCSVSGKLMLIVDNPGRAKCSFMYILTTKLIPLIVYLWIDSQSACSGSIHMLSQSQNSLPDYLTQRQPPVKTIFDHCLTDLCP